MAAPANAKQVFASAGAKYGVNPALLWGIFGTETSFGNDVQTSSAGAQGWMQFEPSTAATYNVDPNNLESSANGAAHYISDLLKQHGGNVNAALNAYNGNGAGTGQSSYTQSVRSNATQWGPGGAGNLGATDQPAPGASSPSSGGGLDLASVFGPPLIHALLYLALVAAGMALAGYGLYTLANAGSGGAAGALARKGAKRTAEAAVLA